MSVQDELIIELPKELVENSRGLSIDIGGSAVKFVYRHKDDWKEYLKQKEHVKTAKVRMGIIPIGRLEEGLQFLKDNLAATTTDDNQLSLIYGVGFGCNKHANLISKILSMKVEILNEVDRITNCIVMLTTLFPREEFEFLPNEQERAELFEVMTRAQHVAVAFASTATWGTAVESLDLSSAMDYNVTGNVSFATAVEDMYPFLTFYSNSATVYVLVYSKDEYGTISPINTGGTAFLGLGSLLCGSVKTYDELIDLAEKGDNTNVDRTLGSLAAATEETDHQNVYASICEKTSASDETAYGFGLAALYPAENFKKEDLIKTLLKMILREQVGGMFPLILANGVRHVIVVGSFCRRSLVRKIMLEEFCRQKVAYSGKRNSTVFDAQLHFPKTAAYLGCIGAFVMDKGSSSSPEQK